MIFEKNKQAHNSVLVQLKKHKHANRYEDPCGSTSGVINLSFNEIHSSENPFTIFGLKNISYFKLEIWSIGGGEIIPDIIINNPQDIISWNGKNINGVEVSAGEYGYRATVSNDCVTKVILGNFTKVNASSYPTVDAHPYFNYNPVSKPPLPDCCQDYIVLQNQYLVQDKTIGVPDPLLYKAEIKISAGPEVVIQSGNTVILEAGYEIDLLPGFTVEGGANFTAQITPCLDLSNKNMLTNDGNILIDILTSTEAKPNIEENNFSVYPNPFSNSFTISLELDELSEAEIFLVNIHGRKVLQVFSGSLNKGTNNIEVSSVSLPQGMYFCVIETPQFRKVVKVVKM